MDWDEDEAEIIEDILPSDLGDLCDALWNRRMIKAARESLKKLSRRDQMILKAWKAICFITYTRTAGFCVSES